MLRDRAESGTGDDLMSGCTCKTPSVTFRPGRDRLINERAQQHLPRVATR